MTAAEHPVDAVAPWSLAGQVAVVTGAGAGIGAATAEVLAGRGARVAVVDVDLRAAEEVAGRLPDALPVACDVASEDDVARLFATVAAELGQVGVLHTNAGVSFGGGRGDGPADVLDLGVWQRTLDVNLTGQFLCVKHALPSMLAAGGGAIVATASVAGPLLGTVNTAYCAAKAGVVGLVRALVTTHAAQGIRATAVCPGPVHTQMSETVLVTEEVRARLIGGIPAGRMAEPRDVAELVAFLASPAAAYLNGSVITVDGGLVVH